MKEGGGCNDGNDDASNFSTDRCDLAIEVEFTSHDVCIQSIRRLCRNGGG